MVGPTLLVRRVHSTGGIVRKGEDPSGENDRDEEQGYPTAADFQKEPPVHSLATANKANSRNSSNDALGRGDWDAQERSSNTCEGSAQLGRRPTGRGQHGKLVAQRLHHSVSVKE